MRIAKNGRRLAILTGLLALAVVGVTAYLAWPHLRFWYLFESLGTNVQGYPEYKHRQTGIVMVKLPGGTFWMGAQKENPDGPNYDPEAFDNQAPVHQVTLSPFLIAKHEVTQAQWKKVTGSNPSGITGDDDRPVEQVSWEDIQKFEAKTGLILPTEAQWEYACRGGTGTPFAGKLEDVGWFGGNGGNETHPVGTKAPNGFGLFNLHGNVWEWVEDVYDAEFYGKPEAAGPDPVSSAGSKSRIFRGGCSQCDAGDCRSSGRFGQPWERQYGFLGFRIAWRSAAVEDGRGDRRRTDAPLDLPVVPGNHRRHEGQADRDRDGAISPIRSLDRYLPRLAPPPLLVPLRVPRRERAGVLRVPPSPDGDRDGEAAGRDVLDGGAGNGSQGEELRSTGGGR